LTSPQRWRKQDFGGPETEANAVNHPQDVCPSPLDTEPPTSVAPSSPTRLAIRTMALIFLLFVTVGATTQLLNTAIGIWFTELFVFLGVAWVRVRMSGRDPASYAGLASPPWRAAGFGFVLGAVNFFALVIPIQFAAQAIAPASWRDQFDMTNLFKNQTPLELAAIVAGVVLAAPFCEEFVFRGVLQRGLMPPTLSSFAAVVLTAITFSAFHLDPIGFAARLELGVVFGWLFLRTGSLWPGALAHAANNLISTVLYFGLNGTQSTAEGPPSWSTILFVALSGGLLLVGLIALVRKDPSILQPVAPREPQPEAKPASWRSVARPWIIGGLAMLGFLALADRRGLVLGWYDVEYHLPPLGKLAGEKQKEQRERLERLRKDARAGKVPLESYRALREELSRESLKSGRDSG
jgi:membrane protease YdiL (CAAX protease family)